MKNILIEEQEQIKKFVYTSENYKKESNFIWLDFDKFSPLILDSQKRVLEAMREEVKGKRKLLRNFICVKDVLALPCLQTKEK